MSKPKASRVSWTHLSLIHTSNCIFPTKCFLTRTMYHLPPTTTAWGQANHPSDCCTVFLNNLFPPFITLKAILLKSKCAVKLTSPKERSGLCLGYSEVMCHIRQKCPCSVQRFGLHSIDSPGILSSPPWMINHVHVMKPQYKFCGHQSSSEFPGWQLHALCHTSILGA